MELIRPKESLFAVFLILASSSPLLAQIGATVPNWTVPPYQRGAASGGISTMTDVTPGVAFVGIQPCRIADTRGLGAPITGGIFANSEARNWSVWGICGIPFGADAISVNFTVVTPAGTPSGAFLLAWPTGQPPPPTAIMTYGPGATVISNAAIVSLNGSGQLTVNVSHSTHIIMDINGYFTDTLNAGNQVVVLANIGNQSALHVDNSSTVGGTRAILGNASGLTGVTWGVLGHTYSNTDGAAGVRGVATRTSGLTLGVQGATFSTTAGAAGVRGEAPGTTGRIYGVHGASVSTGAESAGVLGEALAASGTTYGVYGATVSESYNAAGVRGRDGGGSVSYGGISGSAGVRGESVGGSGVLGFSIAGSAVTGWNVDNDGLFQTLASLGHSDTIGLFVNGDSYVVGNKSFVEPHPTDASKIIRYISLEGNESGTYFRGRGRFQNGLAVIDVPEDFRIVTDPEGLTVQITPIGGLATVGVMKMDLNRIVVQSSRNLEFSYMVNGIRHAYKDAGPIAENDKLFVPMSPDERMSRYLPEVFKQRLISNGTYRADGTVNMETARRLGWDKEWEKRSRPAPQPFEP